MLGRHHALAGVALGVLVTLAVHGSALAAIARVSVSTSGLQGDGRSGGNLGGGFRVGISADGRHVVFESAATNLVPGDTNADTDIFVHDRQTGATTRVSVASDGSEGSGESSRPAISADGRYVTFHSDAPLVPDDFNSGKFDIFVHDRQTGQTTRVSVASDGTEGDGHSFFPVISAAGRHVAFQSEATVLVPGDTNGLSDILVHDRQTGETTRVSVASDGTQANGPSSGPAISADGRYVAFDTEATNLVPGDTNAQRDIFVHDRQTGQTTRVSVSSGGAEADASSSGPALSADGRYVAFESAASNLVAGAPSAGGRGIFLHDRQTGQTTRVATGIVAAPAISADGRWVAFQSISSPINGRVDVFVHDRVTGETTRVSAAPGGAPGSGGGFGAALSGDGSVVAFISFAPDLVADDTNGTGDVFVADLVTGLTSRTLTVTRGGAGFGSVASTPGGITCGTVCAGSFLAGSVVTLAATADRGSSFAGWSGGGCGGAGLCILAVTADTQVTATFATLPVRLGAVSGGLGGEPANDESRRPSASGEGRLVVFASLATNLALPCTTPGVSQIFLRDRAAGTTRCVSVTADGTAAGDGPSDRPVVSADGRYVAYETLAANLRPGCANGIRQIVRAELATGETVCVSVGSDGTPGGAASSAPAISGNGTLIAFVSRDLVAPCTNGVPHVFGRAVEAGATTCFSVTPTGVAGDGPSGEPALSGDGRFFAFTTAALNLVPAGGGPVTLTRGVLAQGEPITQVLRRSTDVAANVATLVSGSGGTPGNGASRQPSLSFDGSRTAFESDATNLTGTPTGGVTQVFVHEAAAGTLRCVSEAPGGFPGDGPSTTPVLSGDGLLVLFASLAANLAPGLPTRGVEQIFRQNLGVQGAVAELLSRVGGAAGDGASRAPALSRDGLVAVFQSLAANLVAGGSSGRGDILTAEPEPRIRLTTPPNGIEVPLAAAMTLGFTWTGLDGVSRYGLEFSGLNLGFANPNGTGPDPLNGFGGAGGAFLIEGTSFGAQVGPGVPPGAYQVRVIGLDPSSPSVQPTGRFSDALTVILGSVPIPPDARPTITVPAAGSRLARGGTASFAWTVVPGVAQYLFEFTGPGGQFANPNGTAPDPANALGSLVVPGTVLSVPIPPATVSGPYQVRVIALTAAGSPVASFSDAVTVVVE